MNYQGFHNFYANSIKALFYIVPFLPLYVANSMLFPYITGRNFTFRIIVEIALIFWIGLAALDKRYRPELSWLMRTVLVFTAVVFVADIFGASFYRSFWSNYERMEGFLMIAHMAAFFVIAGTVFRLKEWYIFAHLILIGSFSVAFWALLQRLGYLQSIQGGNRVEGSIGNPSYLAAYLMLSSVVALALLLYANKKWLKWIYGGLIAFEVLIIYFSATRGTTLALIGGIALFAVIYFWLSRKDTDKQSAVYRPIVIWTVTAAIVIPLFFWSIRNTEFVKSSPSLQRLTSTSFSSQTIQSRVLIWQLALKGIQERPILGWGQENFNLVFNKYFHPRLWQQEPWFDRAHNIVLDWLSNAGILGLTAYLSLFAAAFYALWKLYKSQAVNTIVFAVAVSGFAAHFAQNLTVFDNFNTYFIFFGALAFLQSYAFQNTAEISAGKNTVLHYERNNNLSWSVSLFTVAIFAGVSVLYFFNIKPMQESKALIDTLQLVRSDAPPKIVMPSFMETFSLNTFGDREATEQLAQYGVRAADTASIANDEKKAILTESIKRLENQVEFMPEDIRYRLFLASLGYLRMAFFDQQYIPKAEQEFKKIIAMTPAKQNLYIGLIQLYLGINEYERAFKLAEQMHKIDTEYPDGKLFYATTAVYSGRFDIAEDFLAKNTEFRSAQRGVFIANAYAAVRRFEPMVSLYQDIIKSDSKNPQYHANLAAVFAELGKKNLAKQEAEEAARLDSGFKEQSAAFIKMLGL